MFIATFISLYLVVSIIYYGNKKEDYSHVRHTISELGEVTTPNSTIINWSVFFPVGLCLIGLPFLSPMPQNLMGLSLSLGFGYLIGAVFPCDEGSPMSGSLRQQIHNLGAGIQYFGSVYFLRETGQIPGLESMGYVAILVFMGAVILSISSFNAVRGLLQRIVELLLFGSLLYLLKLIQ
ncbi:MAG: DUF998 domain-containing protein [Saprospiraceae bacterium]